MDEMNHLNTAPVMVKNCSQKAVVYNHSSLKHCPFTEGTQPPFPFSEENMNTIFPVAIIQTSGKGATKRNHDG